jgi:Ni,Fe-hydrogenase III large subunit
MSATRLNTVGTIADRLATPVHQIEYVIRARGIQACGRAGNARVFDEPAVERIASELKRIASDKEGGKW